MKPGKHQRSKQGCQDLCLKVHDHALNLLFYVHTLYMNDVTNTLLLVSSSVRTEQLVLCTVKAKKANKNIPQRKPCYIKHLVVHGIVKRGDLISDNGRFLEIEKWLQARLSPVHFFKLMGIVNTIPNKWKLIIKQSQQHICPPSNDTFQINIENATVNILKVTLKLLYNAFITVFGSKSTNHSPLTWRREGQKVILVAVIDGFRSDLSITLMTDGNFGNVSGGVLFSKVANQRKRW